MAGGKFDSSFELLRQFGERYRADAAVRARVGNGDYSDLELELPEGTEIRVLEQTPDTYYFPLPPGPNAALSDKVLERVVGGVGGTAAPGAATFANTPCHGTSDAVLVNVSVYVMPRS